MYARLALIVPPDDLFNLPPGRSMQSYYTDLHAAPLGLFVAGLVLALLVHRIFIKNGGLIFEVLGWIIMAFLLLWFMPPGLLELRTVFADTLNMGWAWFNGR